MKKQFAALLAALFLLPTLALGAGLLHPAGNQGSRQRTGGTKPTPTNTGEAVVDIDVEVYGGENAPILQVSWLNVEDEKKTVNFRHNRTCRQPLKKRSSSAGETCYLSMKMCPT